MNMKKTFLLLTLCCALIACKKTQVDFTFSPTAPRAGETVRFTNLSSSGEEWEWSFGDGASTTLKSPSHTYKRPGSYLVVLKVDKKNSLRETKEITVYDTIPTFVCEDSVFYIYKDYTFTANVYNPYNYEVEYEWYTEVDAEDPDIVVVDTTTSISTLHVYFTKAATLAIRLRVIMNGDTTDVRKSFDVQDRETNSIGMRTGSGDYMQRIFGERAEIYMPDPTATDMLDEEQDTIQTYSGYTFRLSELKETFPALRGFHIASRKIYYRTDDGLWVANIDGANPVQIDDEDCFAMTLDTKDSRIYWANAFGVWYMPFVGSDNNKFITTPVRLNDLDDVMKLKADPDLK